MKRRRFLIDDSIYPVFVTTTISKWSPVFRDDAIAHKTMALFEKVREEYNASTFAFVLMPSHFHAIIKTQKKGDLSRLMKKWKAMSAKIIIEQCSNSYPGWLQVFQDCVHEYKRNSFMKHQVWQPRFDDFAIRTEEQFLTKINYIHANPVKDKLIVKMEEYRYSSFHDYSFGKNGYVTITLWSH